MDNFTISKEVKTTTNIFNPNKNNKNIFLDKLRLRIENSIKK